MKMRAFVIVFLLLLSFGTCYGRYTAKDVTGTYVNAKNKAVLTIKRSGKKYIVYLRSENPLCSFESRAELKIWPNRGFGLGLLDAAYTTNIESDDLIHVDVSPATRACKPYVEGDYSR